MHNHVQITMLTHILSVRSKGFASLDVAPPSVYEFNIQKEIFLNKACCQRAEGGAVLSSGGCDSGVGADVVLRVAQCRPKAARLLLQKKFILDRCIYFVITILF